MKKLKSGLRDDMNGKKRRKQNKLQTKQTKQNVYNPDYIYAGPDQLFA